LVAAIGVAVVMVAAAAIQSRWKSGGVDPQEGATHLESYTAPIPVPGMVTLVDLGANECIPCKMMAPMLVRLEKDYRGKAAIVFVDVWKDRAPAERFRIRAIPTQIFFDESGKEVTRHEGFLGEKAIVKQLEEMGVRRH